MGQHIDLTPVGWHAMSLHCSRMFPSIHRGVPLARRRHVVMSPRLRLILAVVATTLLAACAGRPSVANSEGDADATAMPTSVTACCGDSAMGVALRIAADYRESALATRLFTDDQFWTATLPVAEYAGFTVAARPLATSGRTSASGATETASIRTITIGQGPDTVLVWSRASEGGSTGTMALADIVRWFANTRAEDRDDALRARLLAGVTLVLAPLLPSSNDVSDSSALVASLQRATHPRVTIGLLERDGRLTASETVGRNGGNGERAARADSAVIVLVAAADSQSRWIAATLSTSLVTELPGRLARAADLVLAVAPEARGADRRSGIVHVLGGALPNDPQQQRLRAVHAAALLSLFDAVATGAYRTADSVVYTRLPVVP